jgi:hypothetical protein
VTRFRAVAAVTRFRAVAAVTRFRAVAAVSHAVPAGRRMPAMSGPRLAMIDAR